MMQDSDKYVVNIQWKELKSRRNEKCVVVRPRARMNMYAGRERTVVKG